MKKENKGENYIAAFPNLKKWINECVCCHRKGYNPELPEKISIVEGALDVYYLKKYFQPLHINEQGLCEVCEKILNSK
ncbi:MAG: hypothetical protein K2O89_05690 [Clostridia bacterium]|nr:hypothetical protein [Clostridia bacterium]